ncbi:EsaB/YukD family protein [Lysinibacillus sp. 54212]|uniref:EsaB/YukD family protein n=1 Tax=Lysinibacillus sp. 54212 TaxID=3119829 RepID=UPI002FC9AA5D
MYIEITIDLKNYQGDSFDLRLSNYYTVKEVVDIVWQAKSLSMEPKEGFWVRVPNKKQVLSGNDKLVSSGIISGDCLEIL